MSFIKQSILIVVSLLVIACTSKEEKLAKKTVEELVTNSLNMRDYFDTTSIGIPLEIKKSITNNSEVACLFENYRSSNNLNLTVETYVHSKIEDEVYFDYMLHGNGDSMLVSIMVNTKDFSRDIIRIVAFNKFCN